LNCEGKIEEAEKIAKSVAEGGSVNNAIGASLLSEIRAHQCDFDGALKWAYFSTEKRPSYRVDDVSVSSAYIYLFQGRPELAKRNAYLYLEQYPVDWYQSDKSIDSKGIIYNKEYADKSHRKDRAKMWLLLASLNEKVSIPAEEIVTIKEIINPETKPSQTVGEPFLKSPAGLYHHLTDLQLYASAIAAADIINLDPDTKKAILEKIKSLRKLTSEKRGCCEETAEMINTTSDKIISATPDKPAKSPDTVPVSIIGKQVIISDKIQFETDKDTLLPESKKVLDNVAELLAHNPQIKLVRVEGHTDARGTKEHNQTLSEKRAASVVQYLISKGISTERLTSVGYGSAYTLAFGNDEESWKINRRVEFLIMKTDQ
jgi:outer membrane protein OmpA-like peptidoglycan-associated protein